MPSRTLTTCPTPGCPGLWDGERCTVCSRKPQRHGWRDDRQRGNRHSRGYDAQWDKLQKAKLARSPLCERCLRKEPPEATPAVCVHHKHGFDGLADPRRLDWNELESYCQACHDEETAKRRREKRTTQGG